MPNKHPTLYSFRRCPYAMRARLALSYAEIEREHREIILRDKPAHMLEISPKGTVPVLILPDNTVIDESFDIMLWALKQNDPDQWLPANKIKQQEIFDLIERNDNLFKRNLDRYKYPSRYPNDSIIGQKARDNALDILQNLDHRISLNGYLAHDKITLADMAIFPFIRQFAHVDRDWFYNSDNLKNLQKWLRNHLESPLFKTIMTKHDLWTNIADSKNKIIIK